MKQHTRCDEMIVTLILRTYDATRCPIDEQQQQEHS